MSNILLLRLVLYFSTITDWYMQITWSKDVAHQFLRSVMATMFIAIKFMIDYFVLDI